MNPIVGKYIFKTLLLIIFSLLVLFLFRFLLEEERFLIDAGGLSGFASIYGALYGIIAAFILFTVWSQFNNASSHIEAEANGLKQFYRFVLLLKNEKVSREMRGALRNYARSVVDVGFLAMAGGQRNPQTSEAFNQIYLRLQEIEVKEAQEEMVYERALEQFKELADMRTKRLTESATRLPRPLAIFLVLSSLAVILSFAFPIFQNLSTSIFVMVVLSASIGLLLQVIFDLDNPFVGFWNLTPKPFERFLEYLEKD